MSVASLLLIFKNRWFAVVGGTIVLSLVVLLLAVFGLGLAIKWLAYAVAAGAAVWMFFAYTREAMAVFLAATLFTLGVSVGQVTGCGGWSVKKPAILRPLFPEKRPKRRRPVRDFLDRVTPWRDSDESDGTSSGGPTDVGTIGTDDDVRPDDEAASRD